MLVREAVAKMLTNFYGLWKSPDGMDPNRAVDLYTDALEDIDPDVIQIATRQAIRTEKFFPRPAVVRQLALAVRVPTPITPKQLDDANSWRRCHICGAEATESPKGRWLITHFSPPHA